MESILNTFFFCYNSSGGCMNYYELLGVSESATSEEINRAYKVQMKKWHPDINKNEDAVSMSMRINEAKSVLLDEVKRREYDLSLKKKSDDTYNKYSNVKSESTSNFKNETRTNENVYENYSEPEMVTKWEYLKDYMKNKNISIFKRVFSYILVLLESFLCFILKWFVVGLSLLCFVFSDFVLVFFSFFYPILIIFIIAFIYLWSSKGLSVLLNDYISYVIVVSVLIGTLVLGYVLPILGRILLSPKVFNFLYNKLDVYLFKKAVGYK